MYKLTIAIPTYNRAEKLKENISKLFSYDLANNVQILISDNFSNDSTKSLCLEFQKEYENFSYVCNDSNIGYDMNVVNCVKFSKGKYIWFLSDDDILKKSNIEKVLNEIEQNNPAGILINAQVIDPVSENIIHNTLSSLEKNSTEICCLNSIINNIKWSTLISSQIIKKELINIDRIENFKGTLFIQIPMFWESCFGKKISYIVDEKLLKFDSKSNNFVVSNTVIWVKNWINMISSLSDDITPIKKKLKTCIYSKNIFNYSSLFSHIVVGVVSKEFNLNDYKKYLVNIELSNIERMLIILTVYTPQNVVEFLFKLLRRIKNGS